MKKIHDMHLGLQFNHCIPRKVSTVVPWKLLKLLFEVKWNCSLSEQHWETKGICSWLLINAKHEQHKEVHYTVHHVGNLTCYCACCLYSPEFQSCISDATEFYTEAALLILLLFVSIMHTYIYIYVKHFI